MSFLFLSTPSARRATFTQVCQHRVIVDFYPRPPRGGRRDADATVNYTDDISIHALREEGDLDVLPDWPPERISIHALREEGDAARNGRRCR